jgi:hypothetical protein
VLKIHQGYLAAYKGSPSVELYKMENGLWTKSGEIEAPSDSSSVYGFGKALSLHSDFILIGAYMESGLEVYGGSAPHQGSAYIFNIRKHFAADTDNDGFDDDWETVNGFDPTVAGDVGTLDSDGDGTLDVAEIFEGASGGPVGLTTPAPDVGTKTFKTRYRRSTAATGLTASYRWSTDLSSWHHPGATESGVKVDFTEQVVESGTGYEIVEVTATMTLGSTVHLFIALDLSP